MNKGKLVKILIVDDEEYVLSFFKNVIHLIINTHSDELKVSIELTTETSPVRALKTLRNEKFNIFIIDYAMREMNGIELLIKIR